MPSTDQLEDHEQSPLSIWIKGFYIDVDIQ